MVDSFLYILCNGINIQCSYNDRDGKERHCSLRPLIHDTLYYRAMTKQFKSFIESSIIPQMKHCGTK